MRFLVKLLFSLFVLLQPDCTSASETFPVTESDRNFLHEVLGAISRKDKVWIADHTVYPLSIVARNKTRLVKTKEEFAVVLNRELTESACAKITNAAKQPLFKNWQGVIVGDGILWFSEYRRDEHSSRTYGIFSIGHFALQPKETAKPSLSREAGLPK